MRFVYDWHSVTVSHEQLEEVYEATDGMPYGEGRMWVNHVVYGGIGPANCQDIDGWFDVWEDTTTSNPRTRMNVNNKRAKHAGVLSSLTEPEWGRVLDAYGHRCLYCSTSDGKLFIDHLVALSKGGHNIQSNVAPACRSCNSSKGARDLISWIRKRGLREDEILGRISAALVVMGLFEEDEVA